MQGQAVVLIELMQKESVMGYKKEKSQFLKIYTKVPQSIAKIRQLFENG